MKNVWGETKEDKNTTSSRGSPEIGLSEFCDQDQIKQYETIVGQLIWPFWIGEI